MEEIKNLVDTLNKATEAYNAGTPYITDKEWDDLYFKLIELENKTGIICPDSPTHKIHYTSVDELAPAFHNHPMLSLDKTQDFAEVKDFILRDDKSYLAMCKMDGLTCSLKYENGELVSAETRGDGTVGEDIFHNALVIPSIPKKISYTDDLVVDGEIICPTNIFEEKFAGEYKNIRNFAAGSIRLLSSQECEKRNLKFVAWEVIKGFDDSIFLSDKLDKLDTLFFCTVPRVKYPQISEDINFSIEALKSIAQDNHYPIDGLVYKFDNIVYSSTLGSTAHHFKNAIAYKFYDDPYESKLIDIEWTMGRTGVLTPVAVFEPVEIDGTTVERASLHNISVMTETLGTPYIGQKVQVVKKNMIIPQIVSADTNIQPNAISIIPPDLCPVCGGEVKVFTNNDVKTLYCVNPSCEGKLINKLDHFCGKSGLDIKGLSKATLERLIDWGWLNSFADLYKLSDYKIEWTQKPGFGQRSVEVILSAIEESKNTTLDKFISAIGIPLIGSNMAKELVKHFDSYIAFRDAVNSKFDFTVFDNFAESKTAALLNFDYTSADAVAQELAFAKIEPAVAQTSLEGLTFVITGKLTQFKNRDALKQVITDLGGKVSDSVSSKTSYLINNDIESTSAKNLAARKLNIPIISEKIFFEIFLQN